MPGTNSVANQNQSACKPAENSLTTLVNGPVLGTSDSDRKGNSLIEKTVPMLARGRGQGGGGHIKAEEAVFCSPCKFNGADL